MITTASPADVHDLGLWRRARTVQTQHPPKAGVHLTLCAACHIEWPCAPRCVADRAVVQSRQPAAHADNEATALRLDRLDQFAAPGAVEAA